MGQGELKERFRQAWGNFPSGLSVVTFLTEEQDIHGLTASAICSVSLDPPMVLVCVGEKARSRGQLEKSGRFVMNFLSKGQEDVCWYFATKGEQGALPSVYRKSASGLPVIGGCYAYLDCRIVAQHPAGDHTIFVGQVEDLEVPGGTPLVFHLGGFANLLGYLGP